MSFNTATESTLTIVKDLIKGTNTELETLNAGINLTELGGQPIGVGNGITDDNVLRVVQVNDQNHINTSSQPVQIKKNYIYTLHNDTFFTTNVAAANQYQCMYPPAGQQFYNATIQTFSPTLFIPTANTTAQLISTLPAADGLGLTGTLLYYSSGINPPQQSIFLTISTLGYVGANPGTTIPNFFRAIAWIPAQFPVGFQANQGNLQIVDDATGTLLYPGQIPISTNTLYQSLVYFPGVSTGDFEGTNIFGRWVLDYSAYHIDNPAGNDSRVSIWTKASNSNLSWRQLIRFQSGSSASGSFGSIPLYNIQIPAGANGTDLMWAISKEVGGATIFFASAFGAHVE